MAHCSQLPFKLYSTIVHYIGHTYSYVNVGFPQVSISVVITAGATSKFQCFRSQQQIIPFLYFKQCDNVKIQNK